MGNLSAMREQYMRTGEGFLCVYAMNSRSSYEEIHQFYKQILRVKDRDTFPIILVANKCDLEGERQVSAQEGKELAKTIGCKYIETSAKSKYNVEEAFHSLVREIKRFNKANSGSSSSGRGDKKNRRKCLVQ
jgi:GTPase KRas protein